jgi:putative Mn2+ efflux pump MntP
VFAIVLTSVALGLSNFAAAIAIGLSGVDVRIRLRVAITFGVFEAAMPLIGLALGHELAESLADASRYVGGGLLIAVGAYNTWHATREQHGTASATRLPTLILSAAALSIDNLIVGFALGTQDVSVPLAAVTIAVVSVALSLLGLELGSRLGGLVGARSAELAGIVLIVVGVSIALGFL